MKLIKLYNKLLQSYGPQGWWPIRGKYFSQISNNYDVFEICIGAILTQNTNWNNVNKALKNLHEKKLLTPDKILNTNINIIKSCIKPAGYFNQKSNYIINFAKFFINLKKIPTRTQLLNIKGIGPETADSILLYAFNQPEFIIDAYTKRIVNNLGIIKEEKYEVLKEFFESRLNKDSSLFKEFHALLVCHAKNYYIKKPFNDGLFK